MELRNMPVSIIPFSKSQGKSTLLFGLGFLKLMFGGMVLFSSAKTIFMILESPDAPSPWPMFGFTSVLN